MSETIELNNVGPIEKLSITIPEDGGIVVLKGRNGSGKTHAIQGVESLYSKSSRKSLGKSDGVPSGKIEGLGVTIRLGRVNTCKGELLCETLEGRVDPSQLVDPGIKSPEAADAKRLASLIALSGIEVASEEWEKLIKEAGESFHVDAIWDEDPIKVADRLRRKLHAIAKEAEQESEATAARSFAKLDQIKDVNLSLEHDSEVLTKRYDEASQSLIRAEASAESYDKSKAAYELAKATIEAMQIDDLDGLASQLKARREEIADYTTQIDELKSKLSKAKYQVEIVEDKIRTTENQIRERSELQNILEAGLPVEVTYQQIQGMQTAKTVASEMLQNGKLVREAIKTKASAEELGEKAKELLEKSKKVRAVARSTDEVLESALMNAGFESVKVHDGRLCVKSDRGLEPFSDLSHGERWKFALDLAAKGLPDGSVLPVCQEAFESLDPDNRQLINTMAKERNLVIVTAEATDGELRAETFQEGSNNDV